MVHLAFKGPTRKDLETDLKYLTVEEQNIIETVIQKDLELRCELISKSYQDGDLLNEWNYRVQNMTSSKHATNNKSIIKISDTIEVGFFS